MAGWGSGLAAPASSYLRVGRGRQPAFIESATAQLDVSRTRPVAVGLEKSFKGRELPPSTTSLGDWYAKPLSVPGEHLILCTSELSLLSVIVPAADAARLPVNLMQGLSMLLREFGVTPSRIERETDEMLALHLAPTASRSVLAHMNDFAYHVDAYFDRTKGRVFLGRVAEELADLPIGTRGVAQPRELALKLLAAAG
jgi:hypothetical protein